MELISIIVPVYNINNYVEKCLISLMNQTYKALEILCINDGSTDDSLDILEKLSKRDSRIKIISQPNKGLSAARNTGIANAKGDYIVFVDGDDWVDIEMCQKAYKIISETNVDIVLWSYVKEYPNKAKKQFAEFQNTKTFIHMSITHPNLITGRDKRSYTPSVGNITSCDCLNAQILNHVNGFFRAFRAASNIPIKSIVSPLSTSGIPVAKKLTRCSIDLS